MPAHSIAGIHTVYIFSSLLVFEQFKIWKCPHWKEFLYGRFCWKNIFEVKSDIVVLACALSAEHQMVVDGSHLLLHASTTPNRWRK